MHRSPGPVVVGVMRSDRTADALALGAHLAEVRGSELLLVCAYPYEDGGPGHQRPEYERLVRDEAEALLAECREDVGSVPVRTLAVPSHAPARALYEAAVREQPAVLVIASTHRGSPARPSTGTVADRLLTGAPCPVAIAPVGYAGRPWPGRFEDIGLALAPAPADDAAVATAASLARTCGASVHVITVAEPRVWRRDVWAGRAEPEELLRAHHELGARRADQAVQELPGVEVHVHQPEGHAADAIAKVASGQDLDLDLLICGSRAYGPGSVVLAGGVSRTLARDAPCAVMVVPREAA